MSTTATRGNALLKRGDGNSPEAFTTIYEVISIGDFGEENDLIPATHMLSTGKEYIYSLPDGLEVPVVAQYFYSNSTHAGLINDNRIKTARNFQLFLPDLSVKFYFAALVKGWRLSGLTPEDKMVINFNLKISGGVVGPS